MIARLHEGYIVITLPFFLNHKAKACGARWHAPTKTWRVKPTRLHASAVLSNFDAGEVDPAISEMVGEAPDIPTLSIDPDTTLRGVSLKPRQRLGIERAWPNTGYALFWVMGAGKTLSTIALANCRRQHGLIRRLLIICPTSIKGVWKKELERYSAMSAHVQVLEAGKKLAPWTDFPILIVGTEGMSQGGAAEKAAEFVNSGGSMVVIDESSAIKNHKATRTETCIDIGSMADFRLILTGTNVTQGVEDLFSQMMFVDPAAIGEISYYNFRNKYCVMGGHEGKKIVGYYNTEILLEKIKPFCDIIRKGDMKLPAKQYTTREVKATPEQVRSCKELAREMETKLEGKPITVKNALEAMLRFQQIAGGFLPDETPLSKNPKMEELLGLLDDYDGKAIIWARFLPEVDAIAKRLEKQYPGAVMSLTGAIPPDQRQPMVDRFQEDPRLRFFVVNQQTGARGLTLTAATLSVYYSNTFSLEDRQQSEDRNHRIGQENEVMYVDLVSDLKIDRMLVSAIECKKEISDYVNEGLRVTDLI